MSIPDGQHRSPGTPRTQANRDSESARGGMPHRSVHLGYTDISSREHWSVGGHVYVPPMSYLNAASKAQAAKGSAQNAASHAGSDYSQAQLATAVAQLAEAVAELAKTMHRES
jgi:hypothetical protein